MILSISLIFLRRHSLANRFHEHASSETKWKPSKQRTIKISGISREFSCLGGHGNGNGMAPTRREQQVITRTTIIRFSISALFYCTNCFQVINFIQSFISLFYPFLLLSVIYLFLSTFPSSYLLLLLFLSNLSIFLLSPPSTFLSLCIH